MVAGLRASLPEFKAAMAPWDAGTGYLNFEETAVDSRSFYDEVTHRRLARVKAHCRLAEHVPREPPDQACDCRSRSQSLTFSAASATLSPAFATPALASRISARNRST
jgi:hypothetical protein